MFGEDTFVFGEDTYVFGKNTFVYGEDNLGRSWASASPIARALYQLRGPETYWGGRGCWGGVGGVSPAPDKYYMVKKYCSRNERGSLLFDSDVHGCEKNIVM